MLVTLATTPITIAIAAAIAILMIITPIRASSNMVSAQVSRKGIFAKLAGIHNLYNKVLVPISVYNHFVQVMAATYIW